MALYALGSNGNGQLGVGHCDDISVPQPSLFASPPSQPLRILAAACGGNHSLMLVQTSPSPSSARVYCAGLATAGACGLNSPADKVANFRPLMLFPADAVDAEDLAATPSHVAATWDASVVVFDSCRVYTLGTGSRGELGLGALSAEILRSPSATRVPNFPPPGNACVVDVAAGMAHVLVVLSGGRVFGWGAARKGQLGEPAVASVAAPREVSLPAGFSAVRGVAGKEFSVLLSAAGEVLVLGGEKWGIKEAAPAVLQDSVDICAGWGNVYVLHADGKITAWGRNDHGQLPPKDLPPIERMAIGSEHAVCLTKDQDVVSWGWGEHGNCGPGADEAGDVKGRFNVIASHEHVPASLKIGSVAAGCATSWVNIVPIDM
ncbi:hypothetical protein TD95_004661 [Thielaviopsis punctulata]|uniref:RCC1-like domain-containing protein n=1 Tax=Thielaviopsis punctulata TaxID=72032 RepID=A0A0F4ZJX7_9PEZI|nr:hypothetical protein TD95_004661 [Thielaviopsis punctulata]